MPSLQDNIIHIPRDKEIVIDKGVGELIMEEIQPHLEKIAQIDPVTGQKETYKTLLSKSITVAKNLRKRGFVPGDILSMCTYNNIEYSSVVIASFFIGTYTAPMDPTSPIFDFVHLLKTVTPKILFCDEYSEELMEEAVKQTGLKIEIVVFGKTDRNTNFEEFLVEQEGESESFEVYKPDSVFDTCCIHFSSGTTGLAKAVCVTHYGLAFTGYVIKSVIDRPSCVYMGVTTPFWISNMNNLIAAIMYGDNRIMPKEFDENTCMKYVQDYKVNILFLTPINGKKILEDPKYYNYDISSLKYFASGGSATPIPQYIKYFETLPGVNIVEGIGMTETGGLMLELIIKDEEELRRTGKAPVGTPIPGFTYKLVDPETGKICGPNEPGELRIKFKGLFKTYFRNPKAHEEAFDEEGFFKTGDVMYYDDKYVFTYVTRIKDVFKYKGWHISPSIIEEELLKHPNISQAVVVGTPSRDEGDYITAAIIPEDENKFNKEEVIEFVNKNLPDRYHIRGGVYLIDNIPRTSTGKLQRRKVTEFILKQKKNNK